MVYNFDDYLNSVKHNIKNKKLHAPICAELESHLRDSADFYVEIGYDEETANKKALEDMGEPAIVGENLAKLHNLSVGQILVEILFIWFVQLKFIDVIWCTLSQGFCQWEASGELLTMLCVTFCGFALALRHKRLLPAVVSLVYAFADLLLIQSFFYVIIIQLTGEWEHYLSVLEYGWNDLNCFNETVFVVSAVLAVAVLSGIIFLFSKINRYIKTPFQTSIKWKKVFYKVSLSVLCLLFALSAATKIYLYQTDIKGKEKFDKVVESLCDYCLENEITENDVDKLMKHFDNLDFEKESCEELECWHGPGEWDYHFIAVIGNKTIIKPEFCIAIAKNGDVDVKADYGWMHDYYSFNPFIVMKSLDINPIWSERKHVERSIYDLIGVEIFDESDLDLKSAEANTFTDIVKSYDLSFGYHYFVERDYVEFYTYTETGGLFGMHEYVVQVKDGIVTNVTIPHS